MSVKIVKSGGHIKNNANGEKKIHCRQNVGLKSLEHQTVSQPSPQLTDESEFPSLNELSNKVCASPQSTGGVFKYSDKLKLHSNQNTSPNYFRFQQEPIKKDLNEKSNQTLSSPQLKNKWFQDTNRNKLNEKLVNQTNKQNEPDRPDFVNRRVLNSSLIDHRSQANPSFRESPSAKNEYKSQSQRQKHFVNKSDSKLHSSVKSTTTNSHVANQPVKSSHQVQSKNEIKLILGRNSAKEAGNDSSEASKKKKKRKSKVKRQIALQTGKITVLTPEVHSKILNQTSVLTTQNFKTILTDINDEDEYPELGKSTIPTSQKENYPKKEVTSSDPVSEDCKKIEINEQKVEISVEEQHLVTKDVTKESSLLTLTISDDKSAEKKGKDSKPVRPNDPITVSFFDILVNKNSKAKVKDLKTEVDPPLSIGLVKVKAKKNSIHPHNLLDSSSPAVKRGKEREKPKPKKPSQLKKIILMDRKARREQLLQLKSNNVEQENSVLGNESELSSNELKSKEIYCEDVLALIEDQSENGSENLHEIQFENPEENSNFVLCNGGNIVLHDDFDDEKVSNIIPTNKTDFNVGNILSVNETCESEEDSMILNSDTGVTKYTEEENFSTKISDSSSDVESVNNNCESADYVTESDSTLTSEKQLDFQQSPDLLDNLETNVKQIDVADKEKAVKILLHTRNFREYCNHLISKDIDDVVFALLDDLARFQDRMHQKDPIKARMKRRMIYGVKEVKKHLKLKKLRCIIVAADIENIETHGGLNDLLNDIKSSAADHHIPCIFALSRKALGKVCRKPVPVSCVGVFNYEGSEINFKKMIELQAQSKIDYAEISTKLSECITDEQISSLLKAKREAPETLRVIRTTILGDFFLENKTKVVEPDKINVTNTKESNFSDREA